MPSSSRLAAALALIAAAPAYADTTVYTTSASFLAGVVSGFYTEAFTGSGGVYDSPLTFTGNGFSYTVATPTVVLGLYRSGTILGNTFEAETLTFTFAGAGATAMGGNFYLTNASDTFQAQPVTVTLSDGTTRTFTPTSATAGSYIGFTSTTPITSLVVSAPAALQFNVVDNFTVGVAAPVPEASSFAMMALGVGLLLAVRRRAA